MKVIRSVELYYQEGSSDKVYNVSLEETAPDKYVVKFSYGRRGSSLNTGAKTNAPVPYEKAADIYTKLVNEKTGKGYKVKGGGDIDPIPTQDEVRDTGVRPQLLNEIEEEDVEKYIEDSEWCAQEKFDGRRRLLLKEGFEVTGANRKGQSVAITEGMILDLRKVRAKSVILDGEDLGNKVVLFDMISLESISVRDLSYGERYEAIEKVLRKCDTLILAPTAWTKKEKRQLYEKLKRENAEGIVFKNVNAKAMAGRPNSGGSQLKFKFCSTASCVVEDVNATKRSVSLLVYQNDTPVQVGNVTVYPNQEIPKKGSIVEIKYLYYFPGGSLFQPVLLGQRDDLGKEDCTIEKLKVKRETVDA